MRPRGRRWLWLGAAATAVLVLLAAPDAPPTVTALARGAAAVSVLGALWRPRTPRR